MRMFQSFKTTITVGMLAVAAFAVLLVGSIWIAQEYVKYQDSAGSLKEEYMQNQRDLIKSEVDRVMQYITYKRAQTESKLRENLQGRVREAVAIATNIYESHKGKIDDQAIAGLITDALRPIRFNEDRGYFFYLQDGRNQCDAAVFASAGRNQSAAPAGQ